jgi:hypothetical protein
MNGDGIDDLGLYVSRREAVFPEEAGEWFFLVSDVSLAAQGQVTALDHDFTPVPFGNDIYAQFGDETARPIVGNFDPPLGSSTAIDGPTTNPQNVMDVNDDGVIGPLDSLLIINYLNAGGTDSADMYLDVNDDDLITPLDALLVINYLNSASNSQSNGEGEANDAFFDRLGTSSSYHEPDAYALWWLLDSEQTNRKSSDMLVVG